jgi:hypothetical protein
MPEDIRNLANAVHYHQSAHHTDRASLTRLESEMIQWKQMYVQISCLSDHDCRSMRVDSPSSALRACRAHSMSITSENGHETTVVSVLIVSCAMAESPNLPVNNGNKRWKAKWYRSSTFGERDKRMEKTAMGSEPSFQISGGTGLY